MGRDGGRLGGDQRNAAFCLWPRVVNLDDAAVVHDGAKHLAKAAPVFFKTKRSEFDRRDDGDISGRKESGHLGNSVVDDAINSLFPHPVNGYLTPRAKFPLRPFPLHAFHRGRLARNGEAHFGTLPHFHNQAHVKRGLGLMVVDA